MPAPSRLKPLVVTGFALVVIALVAMTIYKHVGNPAADGDTVATTVGPAGVGSATDPLAVGNPVRRAPPPPMSVAETQDAIRKVVADHATARDAQARQNTAYKNALAAAYHAESQDPAWAGPAEAKLQRMAASPEMATAGLKPADTTVDCKRSTCRTTVSFANSGQADDWTMLYMASAGTVLRNSAVSRSQRPDGSIVVDIYSKAAP